MSWEEINQNSAQVRLALKSHAFPLGPSFCAKVGSPVLLPKQRTGISQGLGGMPRQEQNQVDRIELLVRGLSHMPSQFHELGGSVCNGKTTGLELRPGFKVNVYHY